VAAAAHGPDEAFQYLQEAVNADGMAADDDLKILRPDPRFQELVTALKRPPAKIQSR
jgi:hypothetical protein